MAAIKKGLPGWLVVETNVETAVLVSDKRVPALVANRYEGNGVLSSEQMERRCLCAHN